MEIKLRKRAPIGSADSEPAAEANRDFHPPLRQVLARGFVLRQLGIAWLVLFAAGAWVIIGSDQGIARFIWPVFFLFLYTLYGWRLENKNTVRFADSIYFMGFLWTLIALIDTVIVREITATLVFKGFGYALVTTGAGMFLRLLVLQFQETLPDRFLDAQEEIDKRVVTFSEELQKATREVERFRERAGQGLDERLSGLTASLNKIQLEIEAAHNKATQSSVESLRKATDALVEELKGFTLPHEKIRSEANRLVQQLSRSSEKLEGAVSKLQEQLTQCGDQLVTSGQLFTDRLRRIDVPPDILVKQVDLITQQVQEDLASFRRTLEAAAPALDQSIRLLARSLSETPVKAEVEAAFRDIGKTLRAINNELQASAVPFKAIGNNLSEVSGQLANMAQAVDRFRHTLGSLETQAAKLSSEGVARTVRQIADAERAIAEARKAGADLHSAVSEVLQFIRRRMDLDRMP